MERFRCSVVRLVVHLRITSYRYGNAIWRFKRVTIEPMRGSNANRVVCPSRGTNPCHRVYRSCRLNNPRVPIPWHVCVSRIRFSFPTSTKNNRFPLFNFIRTPTVNRSTYVHVNKRIVSINLSRNFIRKYK